jgi:hypothetical protein
MPKHDEVRPRGHYAKKLGGEVRLIQVDDDVWRTFGGDAKAIEDALRALACVVARAKRLTRAAREGVGQAKRGG